jgi:hypothetical protein
MPAADPSFGWQEAAVSFAIIAVSAFLVTWVFTDALRFARTAYVAILTVLVLTLGAAYLAWSGTSLTDVFVSGWGWALVAGAVAAAIVTPLVRRIPSRSRSRGGRFAEGVAWEGVVYGFDEAILLAVLPSLAVWQGASALGWTDTTWTRLGAGAAAVVGALLVILVHHLGYEEFRRRSSRTMLVGALVACGLQAVAFLVAGNALAPITAHVVLHGQLLLRGGELPPSARRVVASEPVEMRRAA